MILKELIALNEEKMNTIVVNADALTYNHPEFKFDSTTTQLKKLAKISGELAKKFKGAVVTEVYIGENDEEEDSGPGTCYWSAKISVPGEVSVNTAEDIAEEIAGILWGQYGYGDSGEPDSLELNGEEI